MGRRVGLGRDALDSLRWNAWPVGLMLAYVLGVAMLGAAVGFQVRLQLYSSFWWAGCLLLAVVGLCALVVRELLAAKPERPLDHLRDYLVSDRAGLRRRVLFGLPVFVAFPAFISAFTSAKNALSLLNPFSWDPAFVALDRALHGGVDPWRLLQPLLGSPYVTSGVNFFYNLWFFIFYGVLAWMAIATRKPELRAQFLTAFVLCWVLLGGVLATLLASVGPCYFGDFYPGLPDPFAEQMALLRQAHETSPVWSLQIQQDLLVSLKADEPGLGAGISAMPSLHVAISTLLAILACKTSRWWGAAALAFLLVIQLGSVHLAWHYAIDGYLSLLLTPLIWKLSGVLVRAGTMAPAWAPRPAVA